MIQKCPWKVLTNCWISEMPIIQPKIPENLGGARNLTTLNIVTLLGLGQMCIAVKPFVYWFLIYKYKTNVPNIIRENIVI